MQLTAAVINAGLGDLTLGLQMSGFQVIAAFEPEEKSALTIDEASELSNIGINRIDAMLLKPNCPFVLFVGTKKMVKRKEFEKYLSKALFF